MARVASSWASQDIKPLPESAQAPIGVAGPPGRVRQAAGLGVGDPGFAHLPTVRARVRKDRTTHLADAGVLPTRALVQDPKPLAESGHARTGSRAARLLLWPSVALALLWPAHLWVGRRVRIDRLEVDLVFFDTTTTYFEVEEEDEAGAGLRRFGRPSKDHRPELPQAVIGLALARDGIPVRRWAWPGYTNDASVVEEVQRDLAGWKLDRVVWVVDVGMAGGPQRTLFQRGGGQVIVAEKLRSEEKAVQQALRRPGRFREVREQLEVKEIAVRKGSEGRRFVLVKNPEQEKRDRAKRQEILARLEAELDRLNGLRRRKRAVRGAHAKAVCALKAHPTYGRFVRELGSGELKIGRAAVRAEEKLDGKYLLSTTDPSLSAEDVALGYKQLAAVEAAFKTLSTRSSSGRSTTARRSASARTCSSAGSPCC
jgi:hypothetical protein